MANITRSKIKTGILLILNLAFGIIASFVLQYAYLFVTNSTKGHVVNIEGNSLVYLGYFLFFVILCIVIICFALYYILGSKSKKILFISTLFFCLGLIGGVVYWQVQYSMDHVLNIVQYFNGHGTA